MSFGEGFRKKYISGKGQNACNQHLSHNNLYFQCNIAITNFLVTHTCEIRFHDVIGQSTLHVYSYFLCKNSQTWLTYMVKWACFQGPLFFNLIRWIQLCDKKNLTFVDCCDKILLNSSWKDVIKLAKGLALKITFFKTRLIKFYLNGWLMPVTDPIFLLFPTVSLLHRKTFPNCWKKYFTDHFQMLLIWTSLNLCCLEVYTKTYGFISSAENLKVKKWGKKEQHSVKRITFHFSWRLIFLCHCFNSYTYC